MDRLVVVGASLAGLRAVEAARRAGFTGSITLIGAEDHLPYDRPPLSKAVLHGDSQVEPFVDEAGFADLGVDLRLGAPATGLDTQKRVVRVADEEVPYDALVIATGARPRPLDGLLGGEAPGRTAATIGAGGDRTQSSPHQ